MTAEKINLKKQLIDIPDVENARQLGGYSGADGRKVKQNLLLRTGSLSDISDKTAQILAEKFDVKYVIDFRMENERNDAPDKDIPGAENIWINVFDPSAVNADKSKLIAKIHDKEEMLKMFVGNSKNGEIGLLYQQILFSKAGKRGYGKFFDILLKSNGAVLWHCSYGKDRTGLGSALILYALGVDEQTIMEDFLLTNEVYKDKIELSRTEISKLTDNETLLHDVVALTGVLGENLKRAFDRIKSEYGSVKNYLFDVLGLDDEKIAVLREKFLEQE